MNNVHDTIKNKNTGRNMYNRFRNVKKIGLALIGLAIVVFIIANVRIRSVDSYRKQYNNLADSGQTQAAGSDNTGKDTKRNPSGKGADNNSTIATNGNENVVNGNEAVADGSENNADGRDADSSKNDMNDTKNDANDNKSGSDNNSSNAKSDTDSNSGANGGTGDNTGNSDGNNSGSNNSGGNDNSQNTQPSGRLITCTIEIRCDNATAKKDTITNPGIRDAIPDDGTILEVTTYTGNEGFTVYDVLAAVTAMHNPVIPIVANSDRSYVSSINNLSEKNVGPTSGWTYRVNGVLPMMAANQYKVKDGDVIKWIYVCQWGDK